MSMRFKQLLFAVVATALVAGCTPPQTTQPAFRFLTASELPTIVVESPDDIAPATGTALYQAALLREHARRENRILPEQLALLTASLDGIAYNEAGPSRAIVAATPPDQCPFRTIRGGDTPALAIESAFSGCLETLAQTYPGDDCGCQLLAHEEILHAPLTAFVHSDNVPARMFVAGTLSPQTYLASEARTKDGQPGALLFLGPTIAAHVLYAEDGSAVMETPQGRIYAGQRLVTGIRRGRYVEVLDLRDTQTGESLTVLING